MASHLFLMVVNSSGADGAALCKSGTAGGDKAVEGKVEGIDRLPCRRAEMMIEWNRIVRPKKETPNMNRRPNTIFMATECLFSNSKGQI